MVTLFMLSRGITILLQYGFCLDYSWGFGSLLGVNLVILIVSGVTLAMHYADSTFGLYW